MQEPAPTNVIVAPCVPELVHTDGVPVLNVTGLPEAPPSAATVYVGPSYVGSLGSDVNEIACEARATTTASLGVAAAVQVAWTAVTT